MKVARILVLVVLANGCASLRHQVPPEEPHATLTIKRTDSGIDTTQRAVEVDGRKVRCAPWSPCAYRVTPGVHTVTVKQETQEARDNQHAGIGAVLWLLGSFALDSAGEHASGEPPPEHYTVTSYAYVTNTFTVEAGRAYVLEGPCLTPQEQRSNPTVQGTK